MSVCLTKSLTQAICPQTRPSRIEMAIAGLKIIRLPSDAHAGAVAHAHDL